MVSALSTCDPGNVHSAIAAAKNAKIRVSVVSVAAEMEGNTSSSCFHPLPSFIERKLAVVVSQPCQSAWHTILKQQTIVLAPYLQHVCRRMTEETGGTFGVSLNQHHLEDLLLVRRCCFTPG